MPTMCHHIHIINDYWSHCANIVWKQWSQPYNIDAISILKYSISKVETLHFPHMARPWYIRGGRSQRGTDTVYKSNPRAACYLADKENPPFICARSGTSHYPAVTRLQLEWNSRDRERCVWDTLRSGKHRRPEAQCQMCIPSSVFHLKTGGTVWVTETICLNSDLVRSKRERGTRGRWLSRVILGHIWGGH